MKKHFSAILYLFLFLLGMPGMQAQLEIPDPVRFLALGDSYTIGESVPTNERWPIQLSDSLAERGYTIETTDIIAVTGWTTGNLLSAISAQDPASENYNLVSLLIGVNNQYQGQDFNNYEPQFRQLLDSCLIYAGGDTSRVFVVSIPDYAYTPFGQSGNPDQISAQLDQYNAVNKSVAEEYGITYFNITPISRQGLDQPELVASDNLHPSGTQYTEWVKLMLNYIDNGISSATDRSIPVLQMYPVPASDELIIESEELPADTYFLIQDSTGRVHLRIQAAPAGPTRIPLQGLPSGNYTILAQRGKALLGRGQMVVQ